VSTGKTAQTNQVNILLYRGTDDLLGCLVQAEIDNFKASIPIRPGDNFSPPVMPIQARLGNEYSCFSLQTLLPPGEQWLPSPHIH